MRRHSTLPGMLFTVLTVVALALSVGVPLAASAEAAPAAASTTKKTSKVTDSYFRTKTEFNRDINRCLETHVYGLMKYTVTDYLDPNGPDYRRYSDFRVIPQQYQVYVMSKCKDGVAKKASSGSLDQVWSHRTCSINPSVAVSWPKGVEVGAAPSCGKEKVGHRHSPWTYASSVYRAGGSNWTVRWGTAYVRPLGVSGSKSPCIQMQTEAEIFSGKDSGTISYDPKICAAH